MQLLTIDHYLYYNYEHYYHHNHLYIMSYGNQLLHLRGKQTICNLTKSKKKKAQGHGHWSTVWLTQRWRRSGVSM